MNSSLLFTTTTTTSTTTSTTTTKIGTQAEGVRKQCAEKDTKSKMVEVKGR